MADTPGSAVYRDPNASTERRVEDLLDRMTVEEKAAQLGSVRADQLLEGGELDRTAARELLADGIGHLTRIGGEGGLSPASAAEVTNQLQGILGDTRLGVPAIPHEECLSGYMGPEGTVYPQAIGMASSWDPDLNAAVTERIRGELEAIGCVHALSPVLDVARDLRWGRVEETYGEDPYLVAAMACGFVEGLQGADASEGVSSTLKHFVGHGAGEGGKNRSSVDLAERRLREVHAFPFEAAVRTAGAESVMNAYHDVDGVPCASDDWLLTGLLRGEWNFDGTVVSDYHSVDFLRSEHGIVETRREAGVAAVEAGVDVELPATDCYEHLADAVEAGDLAEATLDEAVRRVLATKFRKGLFEDPTVDASAAADAFGTAGASNLARRAARDTLVILENDGVLPVEAESVAVVGPKADSRTGMLGDYAYAAHYPEADYSFDATTPLQAIRERVDADLAYAEGCTTTGPSTEGFDDAVAAASAADVALAFVGARSAIDFSDPDDELPARPTVPTSGEGRDVTDLGLPGVQEELLGALSGTGTPVVVVLVSGKPHAIDDVASRASGLLAAWLPGEEGGHAIVDVLFDGHDPGGRLPVSIPRSVGQLPVWYNRKPNSANESYVYTDGDPLYPFGYGETYAAFEYEEFSLSPERIEPAATLSASVTVTNTADRDGTDVVQLYARAKSPGLVRPVQELVGFERLSLGAGESRRVEFELSATQLAFHDRDMNLAVEEGPYELRVGRSATDVRGTAPFAISRTKEVPPTGRRYFADVSVTEP